MCHRPSPVAPQCLVAWVWLDEISAELYLVMEELRDGVGVGLVHWASSVRLLDLTQLSQQYLEQELAVVKAAVVRYVHGHPKFCGREFIMKNLHKKSTQMLQIHTIRRRLRVSWGWNETEITWTDWINWPLMVQIHKNAKKGTLTKQVPITKEIDTRRHHYRPRY